jgi:hypothetical protein
MQVVPGKYFMDEFHALEKCDHYFSTILQFFNRVTGARLDRACKTRFRPALRCKSYLK